MSLCWLVAGRRGAKGYSKERRETRKVKLANLKVIQKSGKATFIEAHRKRLKLKGGVSKIIHWEIYN
jgi:hypothetical protein